MIKWISNYLGTSSHSQIDSRTDLRIIDVRDMVDKPGNLPKTARDKIELGVAYLKQGEKVVVCCDYGISRSNAVAAGILSLYKGVPFNDAVREVMAATGEKDIKIDVVSVVRHALGQSNPARPKSAASKRILITGGSGFLGTALVERLRTACQVYAPSREQIDLKSGAVDLDLFVREHEIDCIVHLANPHIFNTSQALGETLILLKNVLGVCRENQIKLIFPSGWEVFSGYSGAELKASESLLPFPKGIYGETKYLCELLIEQHHKAYGLEYVLLRSGPIYGGASDRPKFIFNFMEKAARNEEIVTHRYLNGFPRLDLLHIEDMMSAFSALISSDYTGTLHFGSGRSLSTTEVATMLVAMMGSKSEINHREIAEPTGNILMDSSRAQALLDWRPRIVFEEGLRQLLGERKFANDAVARDK